MTLSVCSVVSGAHLPDAWCRDRRRHACIMSAQPLRHQGCATKGAAFARQEPAGSVTRLSAAARGKCAEADAPQVRRAAPQSGHVVHDCPRLARLSTAPPPTAGAICVRTQERTRGTQPSVGARRRRMRVVRTRAHAFARGARAVGARVVQSAALAGWAAKRTVACAAATRPRTAGRIQEVKARLQHTVNPAACVRNSSLLAGQ